MTPAEIDAAVLADIRTEHARLKRPVPLSRIQLLGASGSVYSAIGNSLKRLKRAGKVTFRPGAGCGWLPVPEVES